MSIHQTYSENTSLAEITGRHSCVPVYVPFNFLLRNLSSVSIVFPMKTNHVEPVSSLDRYKLSPAFGIAGVTIPKVFCTEAKTLKAEYIDEKLTQISDIILSL